MLVLPVVFLLSQPQASGSDSAQARAEVHRIKTQQNLSGPDKARAAREYVRSLSDDQLVALLNSLGTEQFLRQLPMEDGLSVTQQAADPAMNAPIPFEDQDGQYNIQHQSRQQMMVALRSPQLRKRLIRRVANHLLNTSKPY